MEFERYEDVIDAFERDNMGYETLTDYIKGNNIRIAEIDMSPMGDLAKAFNKKDGGMMIAIEQLGKGGITGGKTYHQYHDQFVPRDEESMGYANGGGVGSMMKPKKKSYKDQRLTAAEKKKIKPANQGGGPNYLGKQETVTVPKKWLSDPDHVVAELAYITPREQKILLDENIYGSLKGKPNKGPGGIMSLQGDLGGYDASPGGPNSGGGGGGGGGNRVGQVDKNKQRVQDILQGRVVTGQTAAKGPLTTRYGNTPEYVNVKQPDGTYKQTYVGSAYKSYGQPSFFQDLFSRGASGYRGIKGNPVFGNPTKNFQMKDGPLGMGYYSDEEDFGEIRDKVPFGLTGIISGILNKFKKPPVDYSNMSEFNKLQNIDGQVIDPTGLELNKGMFGFPVNTNVTNQKPPASIQGKNLNDFQIGDPGKYATADALTEANMADYQTSLVDEFTPDGIDRTNLYEDFTDNRDLISETATSPQFNTSLINEFGVKDRGTFDANEGLQFGSIPATSDQGFGLMNSDAAKAAAMAVMSNAFNENVMPGTSDMGFPDRNMNFPETGELTAFNLNNLILGSSIPSVTTGVECVGLGSLVLNALTSGTENTAIGFLSQRKVTIGTRNTACGSNTLLNFCSIVIKSLNNASLTAGLYIIGRYPFIFPALTLPALPA